MVGFVTGPPGGDMDDQQVNLGEVYRLCLDIRKHQEGHQDRISSLEKAHERLKVWGFLGLLLIGIAIDWFKRKVGL